MLRSRLEDLNKYDGTYKDMNSRDKETFLAKQASLYGIDLDDFTPEDMGSQEDPEWDKVEQEILRYAPNDYQYNRGIEAARLSAPKEEYEYADKKWSEMTDDEQDGLLREEHMANKEAGVITSTKFANLPSSITSAKDLYNVDQFFKNTYTDKNLGDEDYYGSRDDRAAVKDYYVDLDRNELVNNLAPKDEEQTETAVEPKPPLEFSEREKAVKERVDNHSYTDVGMTLAPDGRLTFPSVTDNSSKASTDFLDDYKFKVKQGLDLAGVPTRGVGAVATPGGYAS